MQRSFFLSVLGKSRGNRRRFTARRDHTIGEKLIQKQQRIERLEDRCLLATFVVNTTNDTVDVNPGDGVAEDANGETSLRAAIMEANHDAVVDTITFSINGTFSLSIQGGGEDLGTTGDLDIVQSVQVVGNGTGTILDGGQHDRVFDVHEPSVVSISNLKIQNGRADEGGAIRSQGDTTLTNVTFTNNEAVSFGGAILNGSRLEIHSSEFRGNTVIGSLGSHGGAIYSSSLSSAELRIADTDFYDNIAGSGHSVGGNGGAVYSSGNELTVENGIFDGNTAGDGRSVGGSGGAIYINNGNLTVIGSSFSNNESGEGAHSHGNGGAIRFGPRRGDALFMQLSDSNFTSNRSYSGGGALYASEQTEISRSRFIGNTAAFVGGGIMLIGDGNDIFDSTIADNSTTSGDGGGIYFGGTINRLERCTISGNNAEDGAGIYAAAETGTVNNLTIADNTATGNGGGIVFGGNVQALHSSTIAGNSASNGGGIYQLNLAGDDPVIADLRNTIIADNAAAANPDFFAGGTVATAGFNLIESSQGHTIAHGIDGNIVGTAPDLGPLRDNGGLTHTKAPNFGSAAIDAGVDAGLSGQDQRGFARPTDIAGAINAGDGSDIGAFEAENGLWIRVSRASVSEAAGAAAVTATVSRTVDLASELVVSLSSSDTTSATISPNVTFAGGQDTAQVSIDIIDDIFGDGDQQVSITASAPGVRDAVADLLVDDDERPAAVHVATGFTEVSESGLTDSYSIILTTPPSGPVSIMVTADAQTEVSADGSEFTSSLQLTFDDSAAQTVVVRAVDDVAEEGPHASLITHAITSSSASEYPSTMSVVDTPVSVEDDDLIVFDRIGPFGGLVSSGRLRGVLASATDQHEFSFYAEAGETIAVVGTPDAAESLSFEIVGVSAAISSPAPGDATILPPQRIPTDGIYTMRVGGTGVTSFELTLIRNAALEELVGDSADGNELDIGSSALALGGGRYAVIGSSSAPSTDSSRLVKGDFTTHAEEFLQLEPSIWNALATRNDNAATWLSLRDEIGSFTGIDVRLGSDQHFVDGLAPGILPVESTIPIHARSLTEIDESIFLNEGRTASLTFSNLNPSWPYELYVMGFDEQGNASSSVTIQGDGTPVTFTQNYNPYELAINGETGSSTRSLRSYAEVVQSTAAGTIVVDVNAVSGRTSLAGIAIRAVLPNDVDEYTVDLTGRAGQRLDVVLQTPGYIGFREELLEIIAPDGETILATGQLTQVASGNVAANYDVGIRDFLVPSDGIYTVRVTSERYGDYVVIIGDSLAISEEGEQASSPDPVRDITGTLSAIGHLDRDLDQQDSYVIDLIAGDQVTISTDTPFDAQQALPQNSLDPQLQLVAPDGSTVIATDLDSAVDGRNAELSFTAVESGTYSIYVDVTDGTGEYLLNASLVPLPTLGVSVSDSSISENGGITTLTISRPDAPTTNVVVALSNSDPTAVSIPATITIPAGQTSFSLPISGVDDAVIDGSQLATISATSDGFRPGSATISVTDDDIEFARFGPAGAGIRKASVADTFSFPEEVLERQVYLQTGHTISVSLSPDAGLVAQTEIVAPDGSVIDTGTSPAAGENILIQNVPVTADGTYRLRTSSDGMTVGGFQLDVVLNAAIEAESLTDILNDTADAAVSLNHAFSTVGSTDGQIARVVSPAGTFNSAIIEEDFEGGTLGDAWTTSSSNGFGRIRLTDVMGSVDGSNALVMDVNTNSNYALNEAIWTINLAEADFAELSFSHSHTGDETEVLPASFVGSVIGDGVSISEDGITWHTILNAPSESVWTQVTYDLVTEAAVAGINLTSDFRIKFQQYDNFTHSSDGRGYDAIQVNLVPPVTVTEDFETGSLGSDWTSFSTGDGRVQVTDSLTAADGAFALVMDSAGSGPLTYNEAVWTVDLANATGAILEFSYAEWSDEDHPLPSSFTGRFDGDGVAISADGNNWHTILNSPQSGTAWTSISVDLFSVATSAGIEIGSDFHIKFQQYDTHPTTLDGRGFDGISLTYSPGRDEDWYEFQLSDGESTSIAAGSASGGTVTSLELYDASGTAHATGLNVGNADILLDQFIDPTIDGGDTPWFLRVVSTGGPYGLFITKESVFDSEPDNTLAAAVSTPLLPAFGYASGSDFTDNYLVPVQAGYSLEVTTSTPFDDPANPVSNDLDPELTILDLGANVLAADLDSHDGKNATLKIDVTEDATYRIRVERTAGEGEYTLDVSSELTPVLSLLVDTAAVVESAGSAAVTATVSRNTDFSGDLVVNLNSSDTSEVLVPDSVLISAGQSTSAPFHIAIVDDPDVDGIQSVTLTAIAAEFRDGTSSIDVQDNDVPTLVVDVAADEVSEADGVVATTVTITRNSDFDRELRLRLTSSDTTAVSVPARVLIPAGESAVTVSIDAVDDDIVDGTQSVEIIAEELVSAALDPTFGVDGVAPTDFVRGALQSSPLLATLADGKTVIASGRTGNFSGVRVSRYFSDGSPDPSFGEQGEAIAPTSDVFRIAEATAILVQSDGKILIAGRNLNGNDFLPFLTRLNADGTPDPTYSGNSLVDLSAIGNSWISKMTLTADGRVVAALTRTGPLFPSIIRVSEDGNLDWPFGASGILTIDTTSGNSVSALSAMADGSILVAYRLSSGQPNLVKITTDGVPDSTFGLNGEQPLNFGAAYSNQSINEIQSTADGGIVVGAIVATEAIADTAKFATARLNSDGTLDRSFDGDGLLVDNLLSGASEIALATHVQSDGQIVKVGNVYTSELPRIVVLGYNSDGSRDEILGSDGIFSFDIGAGDNQRAYAVRMLSDHSLVILGGDSSVNSGDYRLARVQPSRIGLRHSDSLVVTDNDTSSLTVRIDQSSVRENAGAQAATAVISRNTDTSTALTVALTSSDTTELTVQPTVEIPAGQMSVTIDLNAVDDSIADGTRPVTITATEASHEDGHDTIDVTDHGDFADLFATQFDALSDRLHLGQTDVTVTVFNEGPSAAESFDIQVFWSQNDVVGDADDVFVTGASEPIAGLAAGASETRMLSVQLDRAALFAHASATDAPGLEPGTTSSEVSHLFVVVDSNNAIHETDELNNMGQGQSIDSDNITAFPGDIDGNGVITPLDALATIVAVGSSSPIHDLSGVGVVTPLHALWVLQRIGYTVNDSVMDASPASVVAMFAEAAPSFPDDREPHSLFAVEDSVARAPLEHNDDTYSLADAVFEQSREWLDVIGDIGV